MNKKTIIQLVVIVVAFGAAGLISYNGFFQGGSNAPVLVLSPTGLVPNSSNNMTTASSQGILPFGSNLNFSQALDPKRFVYNQINYPQVDPKNEIGLPVSALIPPPPITAPTAP